MSDSTITTEKEARSGESTARCLPVSLPLFSFKPKHLNFPRPTRSALKRQTLSPYARLRYHFNPGYSLALYSAGKKFKDSLSLTTDDVEFVRERMSLDKASVKELISYLEPVPITDENVYTENKYPN
jgi:hypothetical protein